MEKLTFKRRRPLSGPISGRVMISCDCMEGRAREKRGDKKDRSQQTKEKTNYWRKQTKVKNMQQEYINALGVRIALC